LFLADTEWGTQVKWSDKLELDLSTVTPCVAGPKRPQDRVEVTNLKAEFI
jgi:aconitate hydratase